MLTRERPVPACVARKRVQPEQARDRPRLELSDLHIDIGAKTREEAETLVRVGDAGVWTGAPVELPNGRLALEALDNRLGAYIALESARRVAEARRRAGRRRRGRGGPGGDRLYGARAAAFALDPQVAIAIDVTPATDYPGRRRATAPGAFELGMGAMIARGPTLNKHVTDLLGEAAEAEGIPHAFEVYARTHRNRRGRDPPRARGRPDRAGLDPAALHALPRRALRSRRRRGRSIRLVVAFALRLTRDQSFVRC